MKGGTPKKKVLPILAQWACWLIIWQLGAWAVGNPLFLPGPLLVAKTIGELATTKEFYLSTLWTIGRCLGAMVISFFLGSALAYLSYKFKLVKEAVSLPMTFFKAVPVMAVAIYIILLVDADWVGVIVCVLMCMPMVYTNILEGFCQVDEKLTQVCKIYDISGKEYFRLLQLPTILPYVKAALNLISGISWKAVVAAEVLSIPAHSLGTQMLSAKYYLETQALFAYIVIIVLLSILLEKAIKKWVGRFTWHAYKGSKILTQKNDGHAPNDIQRDNLTAEEGNRGVSPKISIVNGVKVYVDKKVLSYANLCLQPGKITALCGPSGSGKTTLAGVISGLEELTGGELVAEPKEPVTYLFQEDRLFPWLNVYDNIALGLVSEESMTAEEKDERIRALVINLEIEEALWKIPGELSGGMGHRVALARTFAAKRPLIILDEPFRGLDEGLKERIIKKMWKEETENKTVLLITHNSEDCKMMADNTLDIWSVCGPEN